MTIRFRKTILGAAMAALAALGLTAPAHAASGGQLRVEPGWYNGHAVSFLQPSVFSAKPNGGTLLCFDLGPNLTRVDRPTAPLYVIIDPTATQDHCDGDASTLRHDHVLSVAPGDPGYTGAWTLVLLTAGPGHTLDLVNSPITSAAQVQTALDDHVLTEIGRPVQMIAPVIGGR